MLRLEWRNRAVGGRRRGLILSAVMACALIGWYDILPAAGAQAQVRDVATTGTPTPSPAGSGAEGDAFATGQPVPDALRGPNGWVWKATLPGMRFVVYFGIDHAPDGGVIGWYDANEQCMLNQLYAQAQQYGPVIAQPNGLGSPCPQASAELQSGSTDPVDPTHPVVLGLDVVNPTIQPANSDGSCFNACISRLDPARIQHFVDLSGQNHMLFWMDMELGRSPIKTELALLLPYLQQPWVNIALDPEWDMVFGGQCGSGLPLLDTGRMRASEINYAIAQLSALVTTRHLPPKILILHQFQPGVNPGNASVCGNTVPGEGWENIQSQPGVQVVVVTDGVGGMSAKISDYYLFDHVQRIQYAGFKLFYPVNSLHDYPLMTPDQVLNLDPPPLLVMYQ
jgi:hypothetical protein